MKSQSAKAERAQRAAELRAAGRSWVEVAAHFREHYRVNARVAFRLAHGWSQREVADIWNHRWPYDLKTLKNFSYWEAWPASTGHAPSLEVLARLAELYECSVADLLADAADHRHRDQIPASKPAALVVPAAGELVAATEADQFLVELLSLGRQAGTGGKGATELAGDLSSVDFNELARVIVVWMQRLNPNVSRRVLLAKLSSALAVTAAAPVFDMARAVERTRGLDAELDTTALAHTQEIVWRCRRQGDVLGPEVALQTALAQRQAIEELLKGLPDVYQRPTLTLYAEITQLVGWLLFNLGNYRAAQYYYDDARTAAHDAENVDLVTYILCTMSHLATWQGKPRVGIDHAMAASAWAQQAENSLARAYAADVAARAYAADRQPSKCLAALDRERDATTEVPAATATDTSWWYFYDESFYYGTRSECLLQLGQAEDAWQAADQSLKRMDAGNLHNHAMTLTLQGEARIQKGDVPAACDHLGRAAQLTAVGRAPRIGRRLVSLRELLDQWRKTKAVHQLDEMYRRYGVLATGNPTTNKSYAE